ncbi:MAG: beta-lactamase family protein [Saprospiraceae bacterium]|nr:beta-lactamase family protein [Saprospiraceae bacterium]
MFEKFIAAKKIGGINCLIWKNGQIEFQKSYGYKNLETRELMTIDSLFRISSMTKPITSVLAMMLYEEKKFSLNDPITNWFPQFDSMKVLKNQPAEYEDAKQHITLLDLLTHRAGFTYSEFQKGKLRTDYLALGGDIDSELTNEQWINELANLPLISQPGALFNYGRSTDLLGILISTIEGKPLGAVMEEKIFTPLGMTNTFFEVPNNKKDKCVSNFGYDSLGELMTLETVPLNMAFKERPHHLEYQSGGQGLWSSIEDYLKFAKIFVENGSSNGMQVLKKDTIDLMCSNKLTASQRTQSQLMGSPIFKDDYGFGLGLAMVCKENKFGSIPCAGSVGSVGWPGAYGGWWSADPAKNSISIFLTHSMTAPSQLEQGIGFELYEAIDIFSNYSNEINSARYPL